LADRAIKFTASNVHPISDHVERFWCNTEARIRTRMVRNAGIKNLTTQWRVRFSNLADRCAF
jgi:hypothetical protein